MGIVEAILSLVGLFCFIAFCGVSVWLMIDKRYENRAKRMKRCCNCGHCKGIAYDGEVSCDKGTYNQEPRYCPNWELRN